MAKCIAKKWKKNILDYNQLSITVHHVSYQVFIPYLSPTDKRDTHLLKFLCSDCIFFWKCTILSLFGLKVTPQCQITYNEKISAPTYPVCNYNFHSDRERMGNPAVTSAQQWSGPSPPSPSRKAGQVAELICWKEVELHLGKSPKRSEHFRVELTSGCTQLEGKSILVAAKRLEILLLYFVKLAAKGQTNRVFGRDMGEPQACVISPQIFCKIVEVFRMENRMEHKAS